MTKQQFINYKNIIKSTYGFKKSKVTFGAYGLTIEINNILFFIKFNFENKNVEFDFLTKLVNLSERKYNQFLDKINKLKVKILEEMDKEND